MHYLDSRLAFYSRVPHECTTYVCECIHLYALHDHMFASKSRVCVSTCVPVELAVWVRERCAECVCRPRRARVSRVGETKRVSSVLVLVSWQSLPTLTTTTTRSRRRPRRRRRRRRFSERCRSRWRDKYDAFCHAGHRSPIESMSRKCEQVWSSLRGLAGTRMRWKLTDSESVADCTPSVRVEDKDSSFASEHTAYLRSSSSEHLN